MSKQRQSDSKRAAKAGRGQTLYGYDPYSKTHYKLNVGGDPDEARGRGEIPIGEFTAAINATGAAPLFLIDED